MRYGARIPEWTSAELIGMAGSGLVAIGALFGIVMVLAGLR